MLNESKDKYIELPSFSYSSCSLCESVTRIIVYMFMMYLFQTDLGMSDIVSLECKSVSALEQKDHKIDELVRVR